jgi:hypothetical protein
MQIGQELSAKLATVQIALDGRAKIQKWHASQVHLYFFLWAFPL